jgi:hypothetical protein
VLTSFECQERADQKRTEAELHPRNGQRLLTAAEGWLILAGIMRRLEARRPCSTGATEPETCHETAVVTYWAACRGARFPLVVEGGIIRSTERTKDSALGRVRSTWKVSGPMSGDPWRPCGVAAGARRPSRLA